MTILPLLLAALAAAGPVQDGLTGFNAHAAFPLPALSDDQIATLEEGEVLRIVERSGGQAARAIALYLTPHRPEALWVAALDPHLTVDPDLTEIRLEDGPRELWYGYYELPYPFSDRHWTITSWDNAALHAATEGRGWEHAWTLAPDRMDEARTAVQAGRVPGVTVEAMDGAVATPDNSGAWLVVHLADGRTLLGYHARSTVGGSIPDWLVLQLVHSRLDALLRRVADRCEGLVAEHYTAEHPPIDGGDGQPLTWRP